MALSLQKRSRRVAAHPGGRLVAATTSPSSLHGSVTVYIGVWERLWRAASTAGEAVTLLRAAAE